MPRSTLGVPFAPLALAGLLGVFDPAVVSAAVTLVRGVVSGGAVDTAAGSYALRATVAEAGVVGGASGGSFSLGQGFWSPVFFLNATDAPEGEAPEIRYANLMHPSFPNPFRNSTTLTFSVERPSHVRLSIYDVGGRRMAVLLDENRPAGRYAEQWDGRDQDGRFVATGVYFSRLEIGSWSDSKRMLRIR
ncbi:MAG: T9SS type A sorting domain-containing protein [Candidatus Eiseniibacteriota bacterium]